MSQEKELKKEIKGLVKTSQIIILREKRVSVIVKKEAILRILRFLKDKGFWHLSAISCVDWIEEKEFELIYNLSSQDGLQVLLKTRISRDKAKFISVNSLFKNAQSYEREIWEMFGINFSGNSRLIPLFLDKWRKIPPFRKDFNSREYVKKTFELVPDLENKRE